MATEYPRSTTQKLDGGVLDLEAPQPEHINPVTLAVTLARLSRFGGHTKFRYSVAQHSVLVHDLVLHHLNLHKEPVYFKSPDAQREICLAALLHDGHEGFWGFGDIQTPAKYLFGDEFRECLRMHTLRFDSAIARRFNIDPVLFHHELVKKYDLVARAIERECIMPVLAEPLSNFYEEAADPAWAIVPESEEVTVRAFLATLENVWQPRPGEAPAAHVWNELHTAVRFGHLKLAS